MHAVALVPVEGLNDPAAEFDGEALVSRAVRAVLDSDRVEHVVVQAGSATRVPAISSGVNAGRMSVCTEFDWQAGAAQHADVLLVHDPARALTPVEVIRSVVDMVTAGHAAAAVPAEPVTDTLELVDTANLVRGTWDRRYLRSIQSPLCCLARLASGLRHTPTVTDLPAERIRVVPGDPLGMRLDTKMDALMAEALHVRGQG